MKKMSFGMQFFGIGNVYTYGDGPYCATMFDPSYHGYLSQRHREPERLQSQEGNRVRHNETIGDGLPFTNLPRSPHMVIPKSGQHPIQSGVLRRQGVPEEGLVDDGSALFCPFIPKLSVLRTGCRAS